MAADLQFNYEGSLEKNANFNRKDLTELRQWLNDLDEDSNIPKDMHDKQLLVFYNAGRANIEDTKKCIKAYYSVRDNAPDMFDDRNCDDSLSQDCKEALEYFMLPGLTDEGYSVVFHRLHNFDPSKYHFNASCKLLFMTIDACLYKYGPQPGFVFLFDMKGVKLGHITRCPISGIAKFCQYIQDALPANMKAIHIMNVNPYIDKILFLLKPFLKKELLKMIQFHHPNEDMDKFFKECIPKRMVPADLGGDGPDTQEAHLKNFEYLRSIKPYFDAEEQHRNGYSKKSKKKSKTCSTFEDLCID